MKEITVSAKTLDDAITEALVELGVTSSQLEYEVIEKGSPGFFGIGMKQAVIRARCKEKENDNEEIVIDFSDAVKDVVKDKKKEYEGSELKKKKKEKEKKKRDNNRNKHNFHNEKKDENRLENTKKDKEVEYMKGTDVDGTHPYKETFQSEQQEKNIYEKKEIRLTKATDETVKVCEKFLHDVFDAMKMKVDVHSSIDEEGALCFEISGENMGILIGKRGQTLDSLQYLTNRVANRLQEGYIRVKIDTEDYRRRRKETLESLAKNIAYKVKRTRRPVSLEPMNPYERRIIHSALQSDKNVTTHSEGEEPYRRVVVTLVRR